MANNERMGTNVPNRIFVGGLSPNTTEEELLSTFEQYGNVTATKIITDRSGLSKGYGFVTFVTAEEALHTLQEAQGVVLRERKLNVAQAYRKGSTSSNGESPRTVIFPYASPVIGRENLCFQPAHVPMVPAYYMQYPQTANYVPYVYPVSPDNYDQSDDDMGKQYTKQSPASANSTPEYEARTNSKPYHASNAALRLNSGGSPFLQHQQLSYHHLVPKTLNGMTVVAYPSPFVMNAPAILHVKESNCDQENLLSELSYLHSPISTNALTPPPTPLAPIPCDFGASPNLENARKN